MAASSETIEEIFDVPSLPAREPQVVVSPVSKIIAALHTIAVLHGLSDEEYLWLATHGKERKGEAGTLIFRQNEPACDLNFILEGEIHVRRRNVGPLALFIGRAGQMSGKLPFSRMKTYGGDGITVTRTWALDIHESLFPAMLAAIPSMGQRSVGVLLDRVREVTRMEQQAEKLSALGKLAANLAHELNNPASAAQRSAATLFGELRQYGEHRYTLGSLCLDPEYSARLRAWVERTRNELLESPSTPSPDSVFPLSAADREQEILEWLLRHGIDDAWSIAPTLAETPLTLGYLDEFARSFPEQVLAPAFRSFASAIRVERITGTILTSTARIFDLISAIKDYSYMDQAPMQDIDIAQSLENTLSMFGSRLAHIVIETDYDPTLPPISAYGSELNQVWTVLIENAIDAMPDGGTLSLSTRLTGQLASVEVTDNGPGIDPQIQSRIFEPFFTTRPPGKGLGLGLDTAKRIVARHFGFLTVESVPGRTCFQVRLPLDQAEAY